MPIKVTATKLFRMRFSVWRTIVVVVTMLPGFHARGEGRPRVVDRPAFYGGTLVFAPDHLTVAIAEEDNTLRLVKFNTGATIGFLRGHTGMISAVAFSPDGQRVTTGAWKDRTIRVWDLNTRQQLGQTDVPRCNSLAFSPDGRTIASGHLDREFIGLKFWDLNPDGSLKVTKVIDLRQAFKQPQVPKPIRYSPDGRWVAFGRDAVHVVDVSRGQVKRFENKRRKHVVICCYTFFDENGWLVSGEMIGEVSAWNVASGTEVFHLRNPDTRVTSMARVQGTGTILTGTAWNTVTTLDLKARTVARQSWRPVLPARLNHFKDLILSEDGLGLAVVADGEVYLFDVKDLSTPEKIDPTKP